jgi:hypothetical protein
MTGTPAHVHTRTSRGKCKNSKTIIGFFIIDFINKNNCKFHETGVVTFILNKDIIIDNLFIKEESGRFFLE